MARVILAAGGTGGHIFPALAVAETLQARGHQVIVFTDKRGVAMVDGKITYRVISAASPFTTGLFAKINSLIKLGIGFVQSVIAMCLARPDAVIGFGGYPTFAPIAAGRLVGATCILHEQNAVMGRANRLLAKAAHKLALSFAKTKGAQNTPQTYVTGLPVREAFSQIPPYQPDDSNLHITIIGGSLGAQLFADIIPQAIALLPQAITSRLSITQQARREQIASVTAHYQKLDIPADIAPFFDDMPARYAASDLIISRAGASSVQEIATAGRASILIPLATALDDHQTGNAMALVEAGGALIMAESQADASHLAELIAMLAFDTSKRRTMAQAAQSLSVPDAAPMIASLGLAELSQSKGAA